MAAQILKSPISGIVWKLVSVPGSHFSVGDALLLVECMKMEVPIEAPSSGCLVSFMVAEGDVIEAGQELAHYEF